MKKIAESCWRETKSSNLTCLPNQMSKQLLRNLGHGSCQIDPTKGHDSDNQTL